MTGQMRSWLTRLLVFTGLLLLLIGFIPVIIQHFVLSPVLARAGFGNHNVSISRFGIDGCTLHINSRPRSHPPIITGSITLHWTPSGILQRRIDKITGTDIHLSVVNLLSRTKPAKQTINNRSGESTEPIHFPVLINEVEIQHGSVAFQAGKQTLQLPFTFSGKKTEEQENTPRTLEFTAKIRSDETEIVTELVLHTHERKMTGRVKGNLDLSSLQAIKPSLNTNGIVELNGDFNVDLSPLTLARLNVSLLSQDLLYTGKNFSIHPVGSNAAQITLTGPNPEYTLKGSGFNLSSALEVPFDLVTKITSSNNEVQWHGTIELHPVIGPLPFGGLSLDSFESLQLDHNGTFSKNSLSSFNGVLLAKDANLNLSQHSLEVAGINLKLPLSWPFMTSSHDGLFTIDDIRFKGSKVASMSATITSIGEEIQLDSTVSSPLLSEQSISMAGFLRVPKNQQSNFAQLKYSLTDSPLAIEKLTPLFPALNGITGSGKLDLHGNITASQCDLTGETRIALQDTNLYLKNSDTTLENINLSLYFPELPILRSAPSQQFSIGTIRKKNIIVNELKTYFTIESPSSLFIEKIASKWSGGRVFTSSFRLQRGQDEIDIALLCDRLELATILSQFGLAEAGGEGKLSGRIPVVYSKERFFVDDGFLYSSPGEKGTLRIKKSKYLETTVPSDVPHFSPLHFAGAALADFEYNWAKLLVKSQEENLLLQLHVDGKPREKLPFRFDRKNNVFVRLPDDQKGGIDQPIKLDVNFNVPLNELFRYREKFMPLMKQFN